MRIQNIQRSNNTPVNFKASVSEQVKYLLHSQLSKGPDKKKTTKLLEQQIENISKWGSDDSEIVIAKDYRGKYRIGLQYNVTPTMQFAWAIKGPLGKTELSQFLALKEADIINTESTIKYLYTKYGGGFFKRFK